MNGSTSARWALSGAIAFLVLLALLHVLKPELDPSWHFISEYAIGRAGWIMTLAFLSFGVAYLAMFGAVREYVRTFAGRAGLVLLLVSALGLLLGGLFTTDPLGVPEDAQSLSGTLHNIGGGLGMAMPFAAALVSWTLSRHPAWSWARGRLRASALLAVAGFLAALVTFGVLLSRSGGQFGPDVPIGWPNRAEVAGYVIWMVVVAHTLMRRRSNLAR